jgi:primosomal protein N' (replication factor Y)
MFLPDYTVNEELYANLVNLISAFWDQNLSGEVIVQTAQADNSTIRNLRKPYLDFYREELAARRRYGYPPFTSIVKLFFEHPDESVALFEADNFYHEINILCREHGIEITAPYSYYRKQVRGRYRVQILLKVKPDNIEVLESVLARVPAIWTIDREPVNVL